MDKFVGQKHASAYLYPPLDPYAQRTLDVGDGHLVYVEECGNPEGLPVVVLHGGPGGGCSPAMRRYFDPGIWRIVLFDQRGCGRSRPHAGVEANTTWHLVEDIERIRTRLGIDRWHIFGGSWGATLALIYAQTHPERVRALTLRGVFLMRQEELDWFYAGGAGRFWPELWDRFRAMVPEEEQSDLIAAYHRRLFGESRSEQIRFARVWCGWENALASFQAAGQPGDAPPEYARAFARLENHYFHHKGFLDAETAILAPGRMARLRDIPGVIVQGRYDMICPPTSAYRLARDWPAAELRIVDGAGHALSEPAISAGLVSAMDRFALQALSGGL